MIPSITLQIDSRLDETINNMSGINARFGSVYKLAILTISQDITGTRLTLTGSSDSINNLKRDVEKKHVKYITNDGFGKILGILSCIK